MNNPDDPIEGFIAAGRRYCEWAESEWSSPQEAVGCVRELLSELYLKALRLPDTDPEGVEIPQPDDSKSLPVYRRLKELPVGYYWECYNPLVTPAEAPVETCVDDDLGDIYRDLSYGFRCLAAGHKDEAVWQWKFSFVTHWGKHALGALRALHWHNESTCFGE